MLGRRHLRCRYILVFFKVKKYMGEEDECCIFFTHNMLYAYFSLFHNHLLAINNVGTRH